MDLWSMLAYCDEYCAIRLRFRIHLLYGSNGKRSEHALAYAKAPGKVNAGTFDCQVGRHG